MLGTCKRSTCDVTFFLYYPYYTHYEKIIDFLHDLPLLILFKNTPTTIGPPPLALRQPTEDNNYVFGASNRGRQTSLARRKAPTYSHPHARTSAQVSQPQPSPPVPAPAVVRHYFQPYPAYYSRSASAQFRTV